MHIMCMHMAMAVMRSAFNIVSCFYRSGLALSSAGRKKHPHLAAAPLELFPNLPMIFPETF